ncbi:unnamed protein product [Rotaria sp. Silwood1]|nr:unnamed protein product [Rotaria sp. Silwood1]CAF3428071.1 unnamed protein product [Rotaria sp. Silwood1]CAF3447203.1 unnamed protein product [Rotaria sp. Silwood1]CAF4580935.1 unnamed protein product [Rotaria sp. Silwood1]CAF4996652.1 unnamed protein product [Rotaria sp. Silwood1]
MKEALNATGETCVCHCKSCRRAGGSLASINVIVPESAVEITGQPKIYHDSNTDSGTTIQRTFCDNCGSPIYSTTPTMPGVRIVKLGLFDEIPKPSFELYCKTRPSWNKPIDDAKQFDAMPTK